MDDEEFVKNIGKKPTHFRLSLHRYGCNFCIEMIKNKQQIKEDNRDTMSVNEQEESEERDSRYNRLNFDDGEESMEQRFKKSNTQDM